MMAKKHAGDSLTREAEAVDVAAVTNVEASPGETGRAEIAEIAESAETAETAEPVEPVEPVESPAEVFAARVKAVPPVVVSRKTYPTFPRWLHHQNVAGRRVDSAEEFDQAVSKGFYVP